ncbi:MAG: L,D-transpeptidase family protein [Planctomycetaceae bacterium]|nr:L,D-transpeptidase family protein [Planctomycetaceae bacterium]
MDLEVTPNMEPFASKPARQSKLHWWIVSGIAAAFLVWQLDLIPRVRSAATGVVATDNQTSPQEKDAFLDEDWDDIRDHSSVSEMNHDDPDTTDPLIHALARNESHDVGRPDRGVRRNAANADRMLHSAADSGIEQVSFEPDAPLAHESATAGDGPPAVLTAELADQLRRVEDFLDADQILEAHQLMSDIYWKHPEYRELIQEKIDETAAIIFTTPDRQFAEPHFVDYGETLGAIAKEYEVPWQYLARLNRIDPNNLQAGQELKVVRGPFGAVVDLSEFCLTIHAHGWYVHRYQIGTGAENGTPVGEFSVEEKLENPTWYNPDGGVVDGDDPENPLGEFWLGLGNHIGIHGTIDPDSIGRAVSRGCIHVGDSDIDEVFALLAVGSKVLIRR